MQKRKPGKLEVSAIRLRTASARQVSAVELNSPEHLSYDIQSEPSFCENTA
jgi:hypothetical protein